MRPADQQDLSPAMKVAFYATMKPPDDPVPSGDRTMARLLVKALETAGHEVELVSHVPVPGAHAGAP
jgi:hypothetical protein